MQFHIGSFEVTDPMKKKAMLSHPTVFQLVMNFPVFYGTMNIYFLIMFTDPFQNQPHLHIPLL